jgi:hypothetical protein
MIQQLEWDFDAMLAEVNPEPARALWRGPAPLHFTTEVYTLEQFAEAFKEFKELYGNFNCFAASHMWHLGYSGGSDTPGHFMQVLSAELGCWHWGRGCQCVSAHLQRAICACGWATNIVVSDATAVETWHDHAWPGWRDLPVVVKSVDKMPGYPDEWKVPGAPVITHRESGGTRHVPGRSPFGGYDMSDSAVAA